MNVHQMKETLCMFIKSFTMREDDYIWQLFLLRPETHISMTPEVKSEEFPCNLLLVILDCLANSCTNTMTLQSSPHHLIYAYQDPQALYTHRNNLLNGLLYFAFYAVKEIKFQAESERESLCQSN